MSDAPPSRSAIFQYSVLALPLAFASLPLYVHAPDFYTRDLGVNIGLIGVILMAVRLFDAFQDPVIGYISDRHADRRYRIVFAGAVMLILGMAAVFYGPQAAVSPAIWFAAAMILATTGFSIVTINLNMIGGFWRDEPVQRTRIAAWREALALVGLLVASVLPAALQASRPAQDSFIILFWVFGVVMLAGFAAFRRFMSGIAPEHPIYRAKTQKGLSFLPILIGKDRRFFAVCFLTHLAAAMPGVMVLFFIRDYLAADHLAGLFLFLYFISGAVLMGVWVKLAGRLGREKAWLLAMIMAVAAFIWAFGLQPGDTISYGIICVLSGTALGADLALPPAILADRVTAEETQSEATQYYGLLAFIPKAALALAGGVSFLILDSFGFAAGRDNPPEALGVLVTLYALVPCLIKLTAAWLLWRMQKTEGKTDEQLKKGGSHGTHGLS